MLIRRLGMMAVMIGLVASAGYAQRKPSGRQAKPAAKAAPAVPQEEVTFGTSGKSTAAISKQRFLQDMTKPLQVAGGRVDGFTFMYGERSMYEDSAGNPLPVTDYLTQYCYGDTLPAVIINTLEQRAKPGDTAYFTGIKVFKEDGTQVGGKPMKLTIAP